MGCASTPEDRLIDTGVSINLLSNNSNVAQLEIRNNTQKILSYEHWFGQKGMPVAYCKSLSSDIDVCSTEVFLIGDEYFTHETYIQPGEAVLFEANNVDSVAIGVKFYIQEESYKPKYVWYQIHKGT